MYNTNIKCTYNTSEIFLDSDNINDEEKNFIRDVIYRQELLNIFGLEQYNMLKIDKCIHNLYERVKHCKELKECMIQLSAIFMSLDEEFGLMILYAFDYMYLTHICVSEYLDTGNINRQNIVKLKSIISL